MWKRLPSVLALTALLLLTSIAPAGAITNGKLDGDAHPYVGLVVSFDAGGTPYVCSGSLIAARVVLTAGHCTVGQLVSFFIPRNRVPIGDLSGAVQGQPHTYPDYRLARPPDTVDAVPTGDYGVVVLQSALAISPKGKLPAAGIVDTLRQGQKVDLVGFGVWEQARIPGNFLPKPPPFERWFTTVSVLDRRWSRSEVVPGRFPQGRSDVMAVTLNPAQEKGGICFGDSGGPQLLGGTNKILAVTSYGTNINCKGVGYGARVDKPKVLAWIKSFLP